MNYKDFDTQRSGEEGSGDLLEGAAPEAVDEDEDGTLGGMVGEEEEEKWE